MADRPMVNVYEEVDGVETLVYREMNDAELAQRETDQADDDAARGLDPVRAAKTAEIRAALAASDVWVIRAAEDGVEVSAERRAYRSDLRLLLAEAETADSPADLEIPPPPPPT